MAYNTRKRVLQRIHERREQAIGSVEARFQEILRRPFTGSTFAELRKWHHDVAHSLTEAADKTLDDSWIYSQPRLRAFCPLCGEGAYLSGRGTMGWIVPESLVRHLMGEGRPSPCETLRTVVQTLQAEFVN